MSAMEEQSRGLLEGDPTYNDKESKYLGRGGNSLSSIGPWISFRVLMTLLLTSSVVINVLLAASVFSSDKRTSGIINANPVAQYVDRSPFAELSLDPDFRFPYSTGYGPHEATNHTLADEIWEAIDIDAGIVAVPLNWAEEQNLAETQGFPWDESKGVYVINAFHTVHCLKLLHRIVYEAHHGWPLSREPEHALHCIDHMRKDAMCAADDFLLPTPPYRQVNPGPRGQNRVCRNWDDLVNWADKHNACYQQITDDEVTFSKDHREIERYMNCPPGSPYADRQERYVQLKAEALESVIE